MNPARGGRAAALIATAALALALAATASGESGVPAPDPHRNLSTGPLPPACERAGASATCERAAIAALDRARAGMGLAPYRLPPRFTAMAPARQWLILANLDRRAYAEEPIGGLASALDAVAKQGAASRADPDPWPLLRALHGQSVIGYASNWAGGQANALLAYFGWMYDDGYRSGNVACATPSASGCWGHRHDIFAFPHGPVLTMGAAAVHPGRGPQASYALTIVETSTRVWPHA